MWSYVDIPALLLDLLGLKHARHAVLVGGLFRDMGEIPGSEVIFQFDGFFMRSSFHIHEVRVSEFGLSSLFFLFFLDIVTNMHAVRRRQWLWWWWELELGVSSPSSCVLRIIHPDVG